MYRKIIILLALACIGTGLAPPFAHAQVIKSAAVILPAHTAPSASTPKRKHRSPLEQIIQKARQDYGFPISEHRVASEAEYGGLIDTLADQGTALIVVVSPRNTEELAKLPGLYPEVKFTVIDAPAPMYFSNVQSIVFKEQEGAFLLGVLAAMRSQSGVVGFFATDSSQPMRNLAYGFFQGATYIKPGIKVIRHVGDASAPLPQALEQQAAQGADVIAAGDGPSLDAALRTMKQRHGLVIGLYDEPKEGGEGIFITMLSKRIDQALARVFKDFNGTAWQPGVQYLGVQDGYMDYVVARGNKELLPPEVIEKVEMAKDLILRRVIEITPYSGE